VAGEATNQQTVGNDGRRPPVHGASLALQVDVKVAYSSRDPPAATGLERATSVIRRASRDICRWHQRSAIVPPNRRPEASSTSNPGATSMLRQPALPTTEIDHDDRSMRIVEWVLALAAAVAAGVLTFVR
jgi:hypothetical protein